MEGKLIKVENGYVLMVDNIMHATDNDKLSLKNCEAIENGYDLDELVKEQYPIDEPSFKRGFKLALEILGDKKYNEYVKFMFQFGFNLDNPMSRNEYDAHIQSLQQTEWDIEIEMEKVKDETKIIGSVKGVKGSGHKITTYKSVPKLDADGCLILKRK